MLLLNGDVHWIHRLAWPFVKKVERSKLFWNATASNYTLQLLSRGKHEIEELAESM
jgi:hypothetical protein